MSGITASSSIHLQMNGLDIQYNADGAGFTTISTWPVTITNSAPGPSAILNVICDVDLTISSSTGGTSGYFIVGSSYITFDGSSNNININSVTNYPGFIQNGINSISVAGYANVIVKNFITNVTLGSGSTLADSAGWLCQSYYGNNITQNFIQNCTNNGDVNGSNAGGIAGRAVAFYQGSVTFTNCINNGEISTDSAGGIVGIAAGQASGDIFLTNCTNTGAISGYRAGGLAGRNCGYQNGLGTFTNCTNTGDISGIDAGGIIGPESGPIYIEKNTNTGNITGQYAGGIVGSGFSLNSANLCEIINSYSTGSISGDNAGGITGANIGYTNSSVTPVVNITNCYSLGAIATTCGGICGGWKGVAYTNVATINITNTYSYGTLTGTGSGLVAVSLTSTQINLTATNTYVANNNWSDATANANLTGFPTSITANNPGTSWATIVSDQPYILSAFNANVYDPNSAGATGTYISSPGVFGVDFSYNKVYARQSGDTSRIHVFAYKGTTPYNYNSYNFNTFTILNTSESDAPITSTINSTTGVLDITLPTGNTPLIISADGAVDEIGLRMDPSNTGLMQYNKTNAPTWVSISSEDWPIKCVNTSTSSVVLTINVTTDLTISSSTGGTSGYFIVGSQYITFDGSGYAINIDGVTDYLGFIRNGINSISVAGYANVIVKNFITNVTLGSGSTLADSAGWLCQSYYGNNTAANFIQNCTNNGAVNGNNAGGIAGRAVAFFNGSVTFTNCINNGAISTDSAGGIVGIAAGQVSQTLFLTNCTNTGEISGYRAGGLAGRSCGYQNGLCTITNCTNTGEISGIEAGGIIGPVSGSVYIENSINTGNVSGDKSGGIVGPYAGGENNEIVTIRQCFSTGNNTGQYAGGIVGANFSYNNTQACEISNCYSTGSISGDNAGGITGADVGFTDGFVTPIVNITNCYSLGAIATTCGGICGGTEGNSYTTPPVVTITNCYTNGTTADSGSGIVATGLQSIITAADIINCYVAAGSWSDASANANLTGTPNSPGITWSSIVTGEPYVLSAYDAQIYSPNSASTASNYTSLQGLFQPGFTYDIIYSNQVGATLTLYVAAYKGTSPDFTEYNINTFTITNTNGNSELITSSINPINGVLSFIVPTTPTPPSDDPCFLEETQILCLQKNVEVYRNIEDLRKGDLVKTIYNQYVPIHMIGTTELYNPGNNERSLNRLYKCSRENYPSLFEDLYITGYHSILVPFITYKQADDTKAILGQLFVTDNHCRLMACVDEKAEPYNKAGYVNIYHIALEHHDECMNYGIYANGLLVESCSIEGLKYYSNMRMLGEEQTSMECATHQGMTTLIKSC